MDPKLEEAVVGAVVAQGQTTDLARKILALFDSLATGRTILDRDSVQRHMQVLYDAVLSQGDDEDEQ